MSDDTRVLLYSLKHGGYCVSFSRSRAFNASLKGAEQFEPKIAAMFIQNRPSLRLVIADLDGWIQHDGGECPVPEGAVFDYRYKSSPYTFRCDRYVENGGIAWMHVTAWRPAQEKRDGQRTTSVEAASAPGLDAGDVPAVAVGAQPPVAGPVTPDAAGVGEMTDYEINWRLAEIAGVRVEGSGAALQLTDDGSTGWSPLTKWSQLGPLMERFSVQVERDWMETGEDGEVLHPDRWCAFCAYTEKDPGNGNVLWLSHSEVYDPDLKRAVCLAIIAAHSEQETAP